MKKYLKFSWAILLALCIGVSSCSKDDDGDFNSSNLVGKWQLTETKINGVKQDPNVSSGYNEPCDYQGWTQFKADGTFTEYDYCDNSTSGGTWRLNGNTLTATANILPIPWEFKLITVNQTTLVLETTTMDWDDDWNLIEVTLQTTYKRIE